MYGWARSFHGLQDLRLIRDCYSAADGADGAAPYACAHTAVVDIVGRVIQHAVADVHSVVSTSVPEDDGDPANTVRTD